MIARIDAVTSTTIKAPRSIRSWLVGWLVFGVIAVGVIAGAAIFHTAQEEAGELFDYELRAVALSLPHVVSQASVAIQPEGSFEGISDDEITIQTWSRDGTTANGGQTDTTLPRQTAGFKTIEVNEQTWRVFGLDRPDRFIQVAQPMEIRNGLALRLAARTMWPLAILLPLATVLVLVVVSRGLKPVTSLSAELATRSADVLDPVELAGGIPAELKPLVDGLNDLLRRLDVALKQQRTFVGDAAHELRSPLAALKLQLQVGVREGTVSGDSQTLTKLDERLNRAIRLVSQLLALAREDAASDAQTASFDLRALAARVLADASLAAEDKSIELGLDVASGSAGHAHEDAAIFHVHGDEHAMRLLVGNLVDNAIRYTQQGGKIDVVIGREREAVWLQVIDNGPGIPEEEIARVFDRFYRGNTAGGQGSGLGLAIARQVADRHHAQLVLRNRPDDRGLIATLTGLLAC